MRRRIIIRGKHREELDEKRLARVLLEVAREASESKRAATTEQPTTKVRDAG